MDSLCLEDLRDNSANVVKSFIFDGKNEGWLFDAQEEKVGDVYDITDDIAADLHDKAKQNVLVYVNETNGKELPKIHGGRDPFHHVHYLLGADDSQECLSLQFDEWFELLVSAC